MLKKCLEFLCLAVLTLVVGCAHTIRYGAIDQGLYIKSIDEVVTELSIPYDILKNKKVYLKIAGHVEYPTASGEFRQAGEGLLLEEIIIENLRKNEISLTSKNEADLEFVVMARIYGLVELKERYFVIDGKKRIAEMNLYTYIYDTKTKNILYTKNATASSSWTEQHLFGIIQLQERPVQETEMQKQPLADIKTQKQPLPETKMEKQQRPVQETEMQKQPVAETKTQKQALPLPETKMEKQQSTEPELTNFIPVIVPFTGRFIKGKVVNIKGKSIGVALVKIFKGDKEIQRFTTNFDGQYSSKDLPDGTYTIKAWKQGYELMEIPFTIDTEKPISRNIFLEKSPAQ